MVHLCLRTICNRPKLSPSLSQHDAPVVTGLSTCVCNMSPMWSLHLCQCKCSLSLCLSIVFHLNQGTARTAQTALGTARITQTALGTAWTARTAQGTARNDSGANRSTEGAGCGSGSSGNDDGDSGSAAMSDGDSDNDWVSSSSDGVSDSKGDSHTDGKSDGHVDDGHSDIDHSNTDDEGNSGCDSKQGEEGEPAATHSADQANSGGLFGITQHRDSGRWFGKVKILASIRASLPEWLRHHAALNTCGFDSAAEAAKATDRWGV